MKEWWFGLQPGERRTLTIGGVALTLILIYFAGWVPLQEGVASLEGQVHEQQLLKRWMEQSAAEVRQLRRGDTTKKLEPGRSLLALVDQSLRSGQLASSLKRIEPEGESGVKVWLEQASFDEMMSWLLGLERQYGVMVSSLTVDRQSSAGRVDANLSLKGGAAQ